MKFDFFFCAEGASIDQTTNNLSVFNLIEEVNAPNFPVLIQNLCLVFMARRKKGEAAKQTIIIRLAFKGQNTPPFDNPFPVDFNTFYRTRGVLRMQGMTIQQPSDLVVSILVNGRAA